MTMNCPGCDCDKYKEIYSKLNLIQKGCSQGGKIFKCSFCELAFLDSKIEDKISKQLYECGYHKSKTNILNEAFAEISVFLTVKQLHKYLFRGSVLDVGCGKGLFLSYIKNAGFDEHGVEPSYDGYEICTKNKGLNVINSELIENMFPSCYFDLVTMWHSLEHIAQPTLILKEVRRILKPNGVLVIEVPNISCLESKIFKENWYQLDIPKHRCFYNKTSMSKLLESNGFQAISYSTESFFTLILSPFRSYALAIQNKNFLLTIFLLPAVFLLIIAKMFPILNLRSCIRVYARNMR